MNRLGSREVGKMHCSTTLTWMICNAVPTHASFGKSLRILMQMKWFFWSSLFGNKKQLIECCACLLFSLLFLIKKRERMGTKYYKNFIEHPAYLHNQRQKKKCSSKLQCKFKLKLQQFNSLWFYRIANDIIIPRCTCSEIVFFEK